MQSEGIQSRAKLKLRCTDVKHYCIFLFNFKRNTSAIQSVLLTDAPYTLRLGDEDHDDVINSEIFLETEILVKLKWTHSCISCPRWVYFS